MCILLACMFVHHVYAWCPHRSEGGFGCPEIGVIGG